MSGNRHCVLISISPFLGSITLMLTPPNLGEGGNSPTTLLPNVHLPAHPTSPGTPGRVWLNLAAGVCLAVSCPEVYSLLSVLLSLFLVSTPRILIFVRNTHPWHFQTSIISHMLTITPSSIHTGMSYTYSLCKHGKPFNLLRS